MKVKIFKTYDNSILKEGKKYAWSGVVDNLYNSYRWVDMKCKITKVGKNKVTIYDYDDNKEYKYSNEDLMNMSTTFKKWKWWLL